MPFSVVIATLGRPEVLAATLDSVAACDPLPLEIVVVDGDEKRSSEPVASARRDVDVRYITAPAGLPRQRNAGIDTAAGDVIVFLDDDVTVPRNTFTVLERVFADDSVLGATARIVEPQTSRIGKKHSPVRRLLPGGGAEGTFTRYGYPRRLIDLETERDIEFMHGSFMAVRSTMARALRFDEALPGYALAEDEDFSYRVSRRGRIRFVPELHVVHAKAGHGSRDARAFGRTLVVNRAYLFKKNFRRTLRARLQFWMLIGLFVGHRLVNREFAEALGLIQGTGASFRYPLEKARTPHGVPKIAFVSSHARAGGSERYLAVLLDELGDDWIGPILALEDGPLVDELRAAGRRVDVVATSGSPLSIGVAALRLRRTLKKARPSVIHANGIKAALASGPSRKTAPIVWVKHDFSFDGALAAAAARRSSLVVGVSAAVLEGLPDAASEVVHTGLDLKAAPHRPAAREALVAELGVGPESLLVGLVGRLHPVKGHIDLLRALGSSGRRPENLELVFIGGVDPAVPDHAQAVVAEARTQGLRPHLLGHRDDAPAVMAGLDMAVMPSSRNGGTNVEALPLTALELLAVGTPLIAYGVGGIPELVGDCAVLVEAADLSGLADAIVSLAKDDSRRGEMAACGRKRVGEHFTTERMVGKMKDVYLRVAKT